MIKIKPGVTLHVMTPQIVLALGVADEVYKMFGQDCWITSINDGVHLGAPVWGDSLNPHMLGKAVDLRTQNIPAERRGALYHYLKDALGSSFVCLFEHQGLPQEHIHIQFGHVENPNLENPNA